ncbi:MAG: hypothetical protein APR63_12095 [Desulfuromonas sp. SDB]|nr:MAG: hypothetical protein APR63_12095 [Desulfuromonas sp. SDB]
MNKLIACCGLDCAICDIRQCPENPELAKRIAQWFKENIDEKAEPSWFHCSWCRGDRNNHWSADCWILQCCVDKKHLEYCSQCDEFPCEKLVAWSEENNKYQQAFQRLVDMKSQL